MLLWKLSPVVQPGIGHCSTRYSRPARLGLLQQRDEHLLEAAQVLSRPAAGCGPRSRTPPSPPAAAAASNTRTMKSCLRAADGLVVVQHVVEVAEVGDAHPGGVHGRQHALGAGRRRTGGAGPGCWPPDPAWPRAGTSASAGVQRRRQLDVRAVQLAGECSQSSMARSGSASRTSRGVSSCRAAVRTLSFMNLGSKPAALVGHGSESRPEPRPRSSCGPARWHTPLLSIENCCCSERVHPRRLAVLILPLARPAPPPRGAPRRRPARARARRPPPTTAQGDAPPPASGAPGPAAGAAAGLRRPRLAPADPCPAPRVLTPPAAAARDRLYIDAGLEAILLGDLRRAEALFSRAAARGEHAPSCAPPPPCWPSGRRRWPTAARCASRATRRRPPAPDRPPGHRPPGVPADHDHAGRGRLGLDAAGGPGADGRRRRRTRRRGPVHGDRRQQLRRPVPGHPVARGHLGPGQHGVLRRHPRPGVRPADQQPDLRRGGRQHRRRSRAGVRRQPAAGERRRGDRRDVVGRPQRHERRGRPHRRGLGD